MDAIGIILLWIVLIYIYSPDCNCQKYQTLQTYVLSIRIVHKTSFTFTCLNIVEHIYIYIAMREFKILRCRHHRAFSREGKTINFIEHIHYTYILLYYNLQLSMGTYLKHTKKHLQEVYIYIVHKHIFVHTY